MEALLRSNQPQVDVTMIAPVVRALIHGLHTHPKGHRTLDRQLQPLTCSLWPPVPPSRLSFPPLVHLSIRPFVHLSNCPFPFVHLSMCLSLLSFLPVISCTAHNFAFFLCSLVSLLNADCVDFFATQCISTARLIELLLGASS